ncbi:FAD:protein FMN transferase [Clostridium pasteurianum]|uniref:FAD:protein FMN transferase n=1 Tax=Clostridium pasteurianum BC1 TaxID=86416 RepID=R4K8Y0_CLOPA|nr:FAD:protein FMN transferase [Clostridium pasteurianum]AGK96090.1 membrane-associated lipoprotein involved in thiamine biosynthesis [Clostridium pasteurianum BC1]
MSEFYEMETFCMGTVISQRVFGEKAEIAATKVEEEMKRLEALMSFFLESSEISKLNRAAGKQEVELGCESLYVLNRAKYFSEICGGTFDITVGPIAKLWGIFTNHAKVPSKEEIDKALSFTGYKDIIIDNGLGTAKLERTGESVDLGAIAKGYAADRAIEIYKQQGIESAFINLGGNVLVLGNKPDGTPWKVGIQNPLLERGQCLGAVKAVDKTIVTSGDYVRYFEKDNVKYHHILDPRTGYPANSGLMSATIVSEKSIGADALSTAIFILGLEDGMKLINSLKDMEAIFITKDKEIYVTEGLRKDFILFEGTDFSAL